MYALLLSTRNSRCFALPTYAGIHMRPMTMIMIPNNLIINSHSLSQIPSTNFFFFLFLIYFSPYQTDLGPVSDWIELYQAKFKNAKKKKKKVTGPRAAACMATRPIHVYWTRVPRPNWHTCAFQLTIDITHKYPNYR